MSLLLGKWQLLFENLVTASVGNDDREALRKVSLVYGLALIGIFVLCVLGFIALSQGAFWLALVDCGTVLFLFTLLFYLRRTGKYVLCCYLGITVMYWLYLLLFVTGGVDTTGFMWYYTFPLLALFLLGARVGVIASFLLLIPTVLFLVFDCCVAEVAIYTPSFVYRFIPSFVTVMLFSYMYERNREKNQKILENTFLQQDTLIASRTRELAELNKNLQQMVAEQTREIKTTQEQLLHAEKLSAIGSLVASIAHEFNNPLCGVSNVLNRIVRKNLVDRSSQELVVMAVTECERMKNLIQDLQAFNRPTSGLNKTFEMRRPIKEILLLLQKELKIKQISVVKQYSDPPILINAVEDQIKQVVLNLLKNSAEAIPDSGGTITIGIGQEDKDCVLTIHDTGVGITPEDMKNIFEPFFTTKSAVKGTGLGLSVSHGIIKSHGGRIRVSSEQAKGTTFTVILPINYNLTDNEPTI